MIARLSRNCADAQAAGIPNESHVHCTGCECQCHFVPMPRDFRERLEAARAGEDG